MASLLLLAMLAAGGALAGPPVGPVPAAAAAAKATFERTFALANSTCHDGNVVLNRDGQAASTPEHRPWSLHAHSAAGGLALPRCATVAALQHSLAAGSRVAKGQPPRFEPAGCRIHWPSPAEACAVLSAYSSAVFVGDSLTRHLFSALMILLSGDAVRGAQPPGLAPDSANGCTCDGQFSEAPLCRWTMNRRNGSQELLLGGRCPGAGSLQFVNAAGLVAAPGAAPPPPPAPPLGLCPAGGAGGGGDARPALLFVAGGMHFGVDAALTRARLLAPVVQGARSEVASGCPATALRLAWGSLGAQDRALDKKYPRQARELVAVFNAAMAAEASRLGGTPLDFLPATRDAPSSDGVHQLTDANVLKAAAVLELMRLLNGG